MNSSPKVTLNAYLDCVETSRPGHALVGELLGARGGLARGQLGDKFSASVPDPTATQTNLEGVTID